VSQAANSNPLIAPFPGIRFAQPELSAILCPPYDIISPAEQQELYARDPHNIVRVELAIPSDALDRYQTAAQAWQGWLAQGVLATDEPALYVLQAEFAHQGKHYVSTGFFAALALEPPEAGRVLPHENTNPVAKADRLALMQATHANISPVWLIYHNPVLAKLLSRAAAGAPTATAEFPAGIHYALWRIDDAELCAQASATLGNGPVFIADGHHRYETGMTYAREQATQHPDLPADAPCNFILAFLTEASDPGLLIMPTHRAVGVGEDLPKLWMHIKEVCDILQVADLASLLARTDAAAHAIGFYTKADGYWLLEPKSTVDATPVELLHQEIVAPLFGGEPYIGYYKDPQETQRVVDSGEYVAAFFVRALTSQELIRAASKVARLPRKSTYFWPKIPTGLVMREL
jgi:uncharacterized protein (DUF1015 family)